ncbi:hypothetical protein D3C87_2147070 [compost metagenome]
MVKFGRTWALRNSSRRASSASPESPNMKLGSTSGIDVTDQAVSVPLPSRRERADITGRTEAASWKAVMP